MEIRESSAVVSGSASGLGEAVVRALVHRGAYAVIADVAREKGEALARELGERAAFVHCDVADEEAVQRAIERATSLAPLRAVISCAGIAVAKRTVDKQGAPHDRATFQRVLDVNVHGSFNFARLGAGAMVAHTPVHDGQRGVIINTASIAAYDGQIGQIAYATSKGALVSMTLPLARDLAAHAIRVCTICPGLMDTPLLRGLPEAARTALAATIPFPARLGDPADFARLALHIVENDYLNGECIRLDGALRMAPK